MFNLHKLSLSLSLLISFFKHLLEVDQLSPSFKNCKIVISLNDNELCRLRIKVNYCILYLGTFCFVSVT